MPEEKDEKTSGAAAQNQGATGGTKPAVAGGGAPKVAATRRGFRADGKTPFVGVSADTGRRRGISLYGAMEEFGEEEGKKIFLRLARAGGYGDVLSIGEDPSLDLYSVETAVPLWEDKLAELEKLRATGGTLDDGTVVGPKQVMDAKAILEACTKRRDAVREILSEIGGGEEDAPFDPEERFENPNPSLTV